ncbi:MAG: hypothetical protein ABW250_16745 [Pyrinomonadaceae bacterium]
MASRRILYSGVDYILSERLKDALKPLNCFVVRSPVYTAPTLIKSDIKYTLLLFDDDPVGAELASYARTLSHRRHTPVIIVKKSESFGRLLDTIRRQLATTRAQ